MGKTMKQSRRQKGKPRMTEREEDAMRVVPQRGSSRPIEPRTDNQAAYIKSIYANTITIGDGYAGTGKTYLATMIAADMFRDGEVDTIIITRPAVEAGENLGFLPGEQDEKIAPYFKPVRQILEKRLGTGYVEYMIKAGKIRFEPIAYLRGNTFDKSFIIVDEAQNTTPTQMELILSRIGEGTKVVINGDERQCDIDNYNGLTDVKHVLEGMPKLGQVRFGVEDIVRSGIVKQIIIRYTTRGKSLAKKETVNEFVPPAFFKSANVT